jgi:hypothetical protein
MPGPKSARWLLRSVPCRYAPESSRKRHARPNGPFLEPRELVATGGWEECSPRFPRAVPRPFGDRRIVLRLDAVAATAPATSASTRTGATGRAHDWPYWQQELHRALLLPLRAIR